MGRLAMARALRREGHCRKAPAPYRRAPVVLFPGVDPSRSHDTKKPRIAAGLVDECERL